MEDNDRIKVGDWVTIYFNTADALFEVEILERPYATGDCWKLRSKEGKLYNVQQYNYMVKLDVN